MERKVQETRLVHVEPTEDLVNSILALTNVDVKESEDAGEEEDILIGTRLLGFVHVYDMIKIYMIVNIFVIFIY